MYVCIESSIEMQIWNQVKLWSVMNAILAIALSEVWKIQELGLNLWPPNAGAML